MYATAAMDQRRRGFWRDGVLGDEIANSLKGIINFLAHANEGRPLALTALVGGSAFANIGELKVIGLGK